MLSTFLQGLRELVFPDNCILCRTHLDSRHTRRLCENCLATLTPNTPPFCGLCSRHLSHYSMDGLCPNCRDSRRHYDRAWGAYIYDEPMRRLIHDLKYHGRTGRRKVLLELINGFISAYRIPVAEFDLVVPIPLDPARLRERGFNQSELISAGISTHFALPHDPHALIKSKQTQVQASLEGKQRWTNLEGAFTINPSADVRDEAILLVDDLLTTGATANAAAQALKAAGAAHVSVLTLAVTQD